MESFFKHLQSPYRVYYHSFLTTDGKNDEHKRKMISQRFWSETSSFLEPVEGTKKQRSNNKNRKNKSNKKERE